MRSLWFFVLTFLTWDGLETAHLEGPYATRALCETAMFAAGERIPEWVLEAHAAPCQMLKEA
jgi:hypothetical protein